MVLPRDNALGTKPVDRLQPIVDRLNPKVGSGQKLFALVFTTVVVVCFVDPGHAKGEIVPDTTTDVRCFFFSGLGHCVFGQGQTAVNEKERSNLCRQHTLGQETSHFSIGVAGFLVGPDDVEVRYCCFRIFCCCLGFFAPVAPTVGIVATVCLPQQFLPPIFHSVGTSHGLSQDPSQPLTGIHRREVSLGITHPAASVEPGQSGVIGHRYFRWRRRRPRRKRRPQLLGHPKLVDFSVAQHPYYPIWVALFQIQQLSRHVQIEPALVPYVSHEDEHAVGIAKADPTVVRERIARWYTGGGIQRQSSWRCYCFLLFLFVWNPGQNLGIVDVSVQIKLVSLDVRNARHQYIVVFLLLEKIPVVVQASRRGSRRRNNASAAATVASGIPQEG
mmetsp:Transcript_86121/g.174887  ORF Transcript_86121/g.174887 Transcript_86121/m.174887 type:complete len:388 (-) Transcript_86121:244-1407(-)